ncbi:flagellin FliC [Halomonas sp. DP1Y21-3]|nr:flagellin [Halomonas sp. DP1Y21-3]MBY6110903.1 flagellin FliC [Halomonas sp. DP1Y21-3]
MSVINTNITSMIGQQNLNASKSALTTSMERLSSGLRINSAKDDAAGQAIANRMSAQITGLSTAQRNANDGISVAQTAEGALNQVNDNIQRIRELTVQAQNGTNSQDDLTSIQNEIGQRLNEINRISEETSFNGVKVLQEDNSLNIQVGANDGEAITIDLKEINAETLGLKGFNVDGTGEANKAAGKNDILAAGFAVDGSDPSKYNKADFNKAATVDDVFSALEDDDAEIQDTTNSITYDYDSASDSFTFDRTGVDLSASLANDLTPPDGETKSLTITLGGKDQDVIVASDGSLTDAATGNKLYFNGSAGSKELSQTDSAGSDTQATISAVVTELSQAGVVDAANSEDRITTSEGTIYKATSTANEFDTVGEVKSKDALKDQIKGDGNAYTVDLDGDAVTTNNNFTIDANEVVGGAASFVSGFDGSFVASAAASVYVNDNGKITDGAANEIYVKADGGLTFDAVSDATATEDPLEALDSALNTVDALRSDLGAIQNRFESAITNLSTTETNLSAARSRIEDADYAVEVANMTRAQILQQAGTSVLAQANQVPQSVLSLLG